MQTQYIFKQEDAMGTTTPQNIRATAGFSILNAPAVINYGQINTSLENQLIIFNVLSKSQIQH